ncbi:hypothetical protein HCC61_08040 [Streptomyces sp. HNM0575]|uniref:LamG domain-containing protein n=1 Tax=Streptomyces sp. HNM0575 TaxID=2716338 RepID=UPI00145D8D86|nr:LamG domain-containing protein [Streptomyces sp. HNM0575]NLU72621.1 hypothetical protein [Streptomyces sp. HNM0575]
METTERSSDAELVELVHVGGQSARAAVGELEERHFEAVRDFAALCVNSCPAADQLARHAWRSALNSHDASGAGAVRPHALRSVLHAAAGFAETHHRGVLDAGLASWLAPHPAAPDGSSPGGALPVFYRDSVVTRAFDALPAKLQTVMWHRLVEDAGNGQTGRLLGSGSADSQEISVLIRRAYREFYHAYEEIHQDGMADECRRFHRMLMAYAGRKGGNSADVVPHLQQCGYCSRAFSDLERMDGDLGELLAEALLPFGGRDYFASRRAERTGATVAVPGQAPEDPPREPEAGPSAPHPGRHRRKLRKATPGVPGVPGEGVPVAAAAPSGQPAERRTGAPGSIRARRLTQVIASLGVCSLAVAFAYAQGFGQRTSQRTGGPPAKEAPSAPAPSKSGASGRSESPTDSPSPSGSSDGSAKPPPGGGRGERTPGPVVRGAALEWLFDGVKDGVTADSSGHDRDGTLVGDPLPKLLKKGGMTFSGRQSVTSGNSVFDTDSSFSVAARVKLRNTDTYQTVASQDGKEVSSFQLQYDPVEERWEMRMHRTDDGSSRADEAESDSAPRAGRWTSIAGIYDAADEEIRLYVDGKLQDTVHRDGDRSSEGEFAVGRARLGDRYIRGFEGTVDTVRAFPKALSGAEVRKLADEE